ncbi:outer membrane beta-barrel protein [Flavobacterium sp. PL11]|uniref:outer membrane beta-barrel protein n=1 Tax=Flavobacterium sp. PL11 TaxID=3071717 RepID=UPI002E10855D
MKTKLLGIFLILTQIAFAQQLEFGPNLGYGFTNIANSRITEGKAVIGNALWNSNEGVSIVYYFNNPRENMTNGIHFEFLNSHRGSESDNVSNAEYKFSSKSFNLNYRRAGSLGNNFGIYGDIGFGYNKLKDQNIYSGSTNELVAFKKLNEPLFIKHNEITFLFAIGVDKLILKDKFTVFLEFNGDAGITKINLNSGSYRTQSLGFSTGLRYIVKFKNQN